MDYSEAKKLEAFLRTDPANIAFTSTSILSLLYELERIWEIVDEALAHQDDIAWSRLKRALPEGYKRETVQ